MATTSTISIESLLPAGWTAEAYPIAHHVVINRPHEIGGGFVTLNLEKRMFALGVGAVHKFPAGFAAKTYGGRGWQKNLVDDAVATLNKAWEQ
jgi:hypothetical protein